MRHRSILSCVALAAMVVAPVAGAAIASAATASTTYVARTGADGAACGSSASPCLTVGKGVAQALATAADDMTVQIAAGTYPEAVTAAAVATGKVLHLVGAGSSSTTIDAQRLGTALFLSGTSGAVTIDGLTLTGGNSSNYGGGIAFGGDLTVSDSVVTDNKAANFGGGIASYGTLRVIRSTISGNTAVNYGGGVATQARTTTITDSTVSGNTANTGAGVYNLASTTLTRSTVSGNTATFVAGPNGAGLNSPNGILTVADSTISGNQGNASVLIGGGTSRISGSTVSGGASDDLLSHSGASNTTVSTSVLSGGRAVCAGAFTDGGHNVTSDASCGWGTSLGSKASSVAAIGLQPLAANGSSGPKTMAIGAGSSAHLVVPAADCSATDERGESRPGGGAGAPACDAGAFELQYTPLSAIYVAPTGDDTAGCGAQASPCKTVQFGVDQARFASVDDVVVHIAAGAYTEKVNTGVWPAGKSLTLSGAGAGDTTLDATQTGAVLRVSGGAVGVENLTLTGGRSTFGGGIDSDGALTVTDAVITGNASLGNGGGIFADSGSVTVTRSTLSNNTSAYQGGGVYSTVTLLVERSTIASNSAVDGGGGVAMAGGRTTISATTLSGDTSGRNGGGLYVDGGTATVSGSTISATSDVFGGAVGTQATSTVTITDSTLTGGALVGLIFNNATTSAITVARSVLASDQPVCVNGASDGGHNVVSDDSCNWGSSNGSKVSNTDAIGLRPLAANGSDGPQTMAIGAASSAHLVVPAADCAATDQRGEVRPGGGAGAAFCDAGAYELQLNSLSAVFVATDGSDTPACGASADPCKTVQYGIEQARLSSSDDITVHIAAGTYPETVDVGTWPAGHSLTLDGAGASSTTIDANQGGGVLTVRRGDVTVTGLTLTDGTGAQGGGGLSTGGDVRLDQVEIVANGSDVGGGVLVTGGTLTVTNSTLAGNTGEQAGGGALYVTAGTVTIATTTITGNDGPGAAIFNLGGTVTVSASTLAANGQNNGLGALVTIGGTTSIESSILSDTGCASPVIDGGFNVTSDDSCGFDEANHNVVGTVGDIGLAPLGDFGGPTRTMPPKSFSLAAFPSQNRVPVGSAGCPASTGTDQRGVARPKDGGCDVGAVELAPTTLQAVLVGGKLTATATSATNVPADLPALAGAVTFAQANRTLSGCEQVPVDASGHMSCTPDTLVGTLYSTFESTNGYAYSRDTVSGIASIAISPSTASIPFGTGQTYTVTGSDPDGASLGDVTSSASLAISPDGSCSGAVCSPAEAGIHTVTASLDGLTDNATLTVTAAPVVSTQPRNQTVDEGDDVNFESTATGYPKPTVQWQESTDGQHWTDIDGATSTTLVLADVSADVDGTSYRAVFTSSVGEATSDAATLSVRAASTNPPPTNPPPANPAQGSTPASNPAPGSGPAAALPRTGPVGDPLLFALAGLLLLATGVGALAAVRRDGRCQE